MLMMDTKSFEAAMLEAEQLARDKMKEPGLIGISCRIALATYRTLFTAITTELDRGSHPVNVLQGLEPLFANAASSIIANTGLSDDECEQAARVFAQRILRETVGRIRAARTPELAASMSAPIKRTEGGQA